MAIETQIQGKRTQSSTYLIDRTNDVITPHERIAERFRMRVSAEDELEQCARETRIIEDTHTRS